WGLARCGRVPRADGGPLGRAVLCRRAGARNRLPDRCRGRDRAVGVRVLARPPGRFEPREPGVLSGERRDQPGAVAVGATAIGGGEIVGGGFHRTYRTHGSYRSYETHHPPVASSN